jgi:lysophospholipase L1-like esterase
MRLPSVTTPNRNRPRRTKHRSNATPGGADSEANTEDESRTRHRRSLSYPAYASLTGAAIVATGALGVLLLRWVFPPNVAFETGANPAISSQIGSRRDILDQKLARLQLKPYTGYHHPANTSEQGVFNGVSYQFRTNNQGFLTDYDIPGFAGLPIKDKTPRDRVLIVTGGSAAFGWGASSNERTFPYILERLLNDFDRDHDWRVYNLSTGGWIAYQEFIALDLYGSELRPDWIVLFDGRNDVLVPTMHGEHVPNHYCFTGQRKLNELFEDFALSKWDRYLPFLRYRELSSRLAEVSSTPPPVLDEQEIVRASRFYLHAVEAIARQFDGANILVITQPVSLYAEGDPHDDMTRVIRRGYEEIIRGMTELDERKDHLHYRNAAAMFSGTDGYLIDDCHLSDAGHQVVADLLQREILALGAATQAESGSPTR